MLQRDVLIHLCHGFLVEGQPLLFKHKIMTRYVHPSQLRARRCS